MAHGKSLDLAKIGPSDPVVVEGPHFGNRAGRRQAGERSTGRSRRAALIALHYGRRHGEKEAARTANRIRLTAFRARKDGAV